MQGKIGNALDSIVHFAMKDSHLDSFGKVQISTATFTKADEVQ